MAAAVGDKFREADGGPSSEELLKELEWMVEDGFSMRWRELKSSAHAADQASKAVLSRARLEELSVLWSQRVGERRPFQYVVGCAHWRDYVLCVREGVLIPRPETEQMIDIAQEVLASNPGLGKGLWLDLGTGSGALAIGLGHLLLHPESVILAIDISLDALSFAALNVRRYGLQVRNRICALCCISFLFKKDASFPFWFQR
jgi:release factor glutamine methyltransferase